MHVDHIHPSPRQSIAADCLLLARAVLDEAGELHRAAQLLGRLLQQLRHLSCVVWFGGIGVCVIWGPWIGGFDKSITTVNKRRAYLGVALLDHVRLHGEAHLLKVLAQAALHHLLHHLRLLARVQRLV